MSRTPVLSIVVPAFNESHRLPEAVARFDAAVAAGAVDLERTEMILIDDGSTDDTAAVARSLLAHLPRHRVVSLPVNRGKGAAVRTGISLALGSATAFMDADMAIDPRAIPQLLDGLRDHDVVIGSRALPNSRLDGTYALRAVMGRLFNWLVTTGTGLDLHDTQCGFKAFRTPVARILFHLVRIDRFAFDVEILSRARRLGLRIREVPVQWKHVAEGTIHPLHDSLGMLGDVYRSRFGLLPAPPITGVVVKGETRRPTERQDLAGGPMGPAAGELAKQVCEVVADSLDGLPVPVLDGGPEVTVLLPLVDNEQAAIAVAALRAEFGQDRVDRQPVGLDRLTAFGPLSGRLRAASAPGGTS